MIKPTPHPPNTQPPVARTERVFVDAIDDGVARLLWNDEAFTVPVALLPDGAKEGAWVKASFLLDGAQGASLSGDDDGDEAARIRRRLSKDDPGGDIEL